MRSHKKMTISKEHLHSVQLEQEENNADHSHSKDTKKKNYRKVIEFQNLDCANCAAKIERITQRTLDVSRANVDFSTGKMIVETSNQETFLHLDQNILKIAQSVDANVEITSFERKKTGMEATISIWKKTAFIVGIIIFLIGVATKYSLLVFLDHELHDAFIIVTYLIGYILLGGDIIYGAYKNIRNGRVFDEKFLMVLATLTALAVGFYEEAVSVMIFYKIGEFLQENAVNKSRKSISSLVNLQVHTANVLKDGDIVEMKPEDIYYDDIVLVKHGEKVPLDGIIMEGTTQLDMSMLTGESMLREVKELEEVLSGSINAGSVIKIKVTKLYNDSTMTKIVQMIENASSLKSKSENFISKFARFYTPVVVILALLMVILIPLVKGSHSWVDYQSSIYTALIFLVVSCPCALVISIPLGFFGGIGAASKQGILIKGSNYLEALNEVRTIAFDKTGTLTKGNFAIDKIVPYNGYNEEEVLQYAAYAESLSTHPIARSVVDAYGKENIESSFLSTSSEVNQFGVEAIYKDKEIFVGKRTFLEDKGIEIPLQEESEWMIHVSHDGYYIGHIVMLDELKDESIETVAILKQMGIQTVMLTGDNETVASDIALRVGIDTYYANMLPQDKMSTIQALKKSKQFGGKLMFIGDGVNDAPALGIADVGVAMGGLGSDAAIEVADVVLMSDDLSKLPKALEIARMTRKIVIQNIVLALSVKLIVLAMAPFGLAYIWEAIFADVGVSLIAILNALRIVKKYK